MNFYYFYCLDKEFGPFFIKFCSYFPSTAKLCINGHEYLKCQLQRRGITHGKMSYDLRRLRLHGLIERISGTHRYQLTSIGLRAALFYSRTFNRVIRPGLSQITDPSVPTDSSKLTAAFHHLENRVN